MTFDMKPDPKMESRIDAYLDGELSAAEREAFLAEARADAALGGELELARRLQATFRALPRPEAPPDLAPSVLDRARRASDRENRRPLARSRYLVSGLSAAAMIVIAILLVVPGRPPGIDATMYSDEDVAQALEDVQWALAFVSHMGERTGRIVRDEALVGRTIEPVRSALDGARPSTSDE